jgi:aspartyl-tRNA(Asn)/glutamyl-tRNA(Gln) amidotransferase subunit A
LAEALRKGEVSSREVTEAFLARIRQVEPQVSAYLMVTEEQALARADEVDRGAGSGPLRGVPVAIKDVLCTQGIRTTCASKILADFVPPYDATPVVKAREAGMPCLGKTNMDEFAMGSSTENSAFGPTRNPWNLECVPGGSSGGSAAAVAAGEAPLAFGSDTGGSIRQPASFCGIVGLKPTYGRVSRYGLVAFASSLDQVGPLAGDVRDCALFLHLMAGYDPLDSTSAPTEKPDYCAALTGDIKDLRFGIISELNGEGIDAPVLQAVRKAADFLADHSQGCEEVSLPHLPYSLPCYYLIAPAEASSNLARYDGVKYGFRAAGHDDDVLEMYLATRGEGFGPEVKRRIMLGTYALSAGYYDAFYLKAMKVRTLVAQDFQRALERCDVLISPTSPTVAFKLGEKTADPLQMYLSDIGTIPINLAALPAISIPCGFSDGLSIGLQLIARPFEETTLLRAAYAFEQGHDFHRRRPPV